MKNILVALDGSDQSLEALYESTEIAKRNDAKMFLLSSVNFKPWTTDAEVMQLLLRKKQITAKDIVDEAKEQIPKSIECHAEIVNGNPKISIVQFANENDIDLIVMGATGKGVIDRVLVGSTTSFVVNNAQCNVLVVK